MKRSINSPLGKAICMISEALSRAGRAEFVLMGLHNCLDQVSNHVYRQKLMDFANEITAAGSDSRECSRISDVFEQWLKTEFPYDKPGPPSKQSLLNAKLSKQFRP